MSSVRRRFDDHAENYAALSDLQRRVARELVAPFREAAPRRILDLGAGAGAVFDAIEWQFDCFVAVDFSPKMLALHPKNHRVTAIEADFDSAIEWKKLEQFAPFDLIVSSSSLQWASDLDALFARSAAMSDRVAFAIFTAGTFASLRRETKTATRLRSFDETKRLIAARFTAAIERSEYRLEFATQRELFGFIRSSGIGGGLSTLGISAARRLVESYPHRFLEFETIVARSNFQ
ncbi:biotin synthase [Campylobacterota bacterium]|nr:biotin synthase [Campylobacterota bacterium]